MIFFIFILLHLLLCIFYDTWLLISGYTNLVILKNNLKLKNETMNTKNLFIKKNGPKLIYNNSYFSSTHNYKF